MQRTQLMRAALAVLSFLAVVALTACGDDSDTTASATSAADTTAPSTEVACDAIETTGAFVRLPPAENTAVYLELTNTGDADTALIGAAGDFAADFELHEMVDVDGVMEMTPLDPQRIELPAGETVALEPGGLHVMAMGLTTELAEGDMVTVDLEVDGGCTITVDAEVRAVDMPMEESGGTEDMGG